MSTTTRERSLRVALVGTRGVPSNYGGTETYVGRLADYFARRGDQVVVYCATSATAEERQEKDQAVAPGVRRIEVPSIPTKHLDNFVRSLLSTIHACFSGADIVQLNNTGPAFFSILPRLFGKKTVGAIRAVDSARSKWGRTSQLFLRLCDFLIVTVPHATTVNSTAMQKYYKDRYGKDTIYIPNGVEIVEEQGCDQLEKWELQREGYLLFAARLEPEKGCHTLIEAFEKFKAQTGSSLKLVIAGIDGKTKAYTDSLKARNSNDLVFVGFQSGAAIEQLYANAYAFVLPSSVEGMSNSLLSAMAHARPVIVSDIPENLAVIADAPFDAEIGGRPGISFKLGDADDLAAQLVVLASCSAQRQRRGRLLQAYARRTYSVPKMCDDTRRVYMDLFELGGS